MRHLRFSLSAVVLGYALAGLAPRNAAAGSAEDWPQFGRTAHRNNVADAKNLPVQWTVGKFDPNTNRWVGGGSPNVLWVAKLGTESYGSPVVAGGKVFCATNNGAGYLARYPAKVDLGCLLAFRQSDGQFLWQHSCEKLKSPPEVDYPRVGMCSCPLVEGNRLWVVTNRAEVVCLDTEGAANNESKVVWSFDMMARLGVVQHNMANCSVTAAGDLLLVCTSNGVDSVHESIPAPDAPSFIALDKQSGQLVWADNSPGKNILHGQWSSPAFGVLGGVPQAIFAGGDGWLYSFLAEPTPDGKPKLLWKFDCNPKESVWDEGGQGGRNSIVATPVIYQGRVYIATGEDPESGESQADLWCIDPTRRGDVSAELVVDRDGKPVPPQRTRAVDPDAGHQVRRNPNSAAIWHYRGFDANRDGKLEFNETMHRSLGMVAIQDDLLVIGDYGGLVHCLDAKSGRVHWTHDLLAAVWGSPLIADGKVYLGTQDGDVVVFEHAPKFKLLATNGMEGAVYGSPVVAGGVLYISTATHLFAIGPETP